MRDGTTHNRLGPSLPILTMPYWLACLQHDLLETCSQLRFLPLSDYGLRHADRKLDSTMAEIRITLSNCDV